MNTETVDKSSAADIAKKAAPWVAGIALLGGNIFQAVSGFIESSHMNGQIQFGDSLLVTIGEYAKTCDGGQ